MSPLGRRLLYVGRRELHILIPVLLLAAALWTFASIADEVVEGESPAFDKVVLLVGSTRVYLGVHWPTDVQAGWAAGAAWAILFWLITFWLQQRGNLESDD